MVYSVRRAVQLFLFPASSVANAHMNTCMLMSSTGQVRETVQYWIFWICLFSK